jgi:putative thioredoxin
MSDFENPYAPASGTQMSGTVTFGDKPKRHLPGQATGPGGGGDLIKDTTTADLPPT